uniref:Uncharacterized protein n=1 Tax=Coprinopsis marcescibilis TaxID=230819 RepID=A0A5C3KCI6_COPMA|nr:hypothetical protein FA15DRAFT_710469 [Coprinopsis marcescibilis]
MLSTTPQGQANPIVVIKYISALGDFKRAPSICCTGRSVINIHNRCEVHFPLPLNLSFLDPCQIPPAPQGYIQALAFHPAPALVHAQGSSLVSMKHRWPQQARPRS